MNCSNTSLRIEPAGPEHAELVARLTRTAFGGHAEKLGVRLDAWPTFVENETAAMVTERMAGGGTVFLAWLGNEPVGTVTCPPATNPKPEIRRLAVLPEYRGNAYGELLLAHAETHFRQRGIRRLCLTIAGPFDRLRAFYERLGYRPVRVRRKPSVPFTLVDLEKSLDSEPVPVVPAPVEPLLDWWYPRAAAILGPQLRSALLAGSVTLGDFQPGWSDVDVCVVVREPVTEPAAERLGRLHDEMQQFFIRERHAGWPSGQAIEGPYITLNLAADPVATDFHYVAGGTTRRRAHGNPITPFDRFILANLGRVYRGQPVHFAPPTAESLQAQLAADLALLTNTSEGCLNSPIWLCGIVHWITRSIVFWRDGTMLSKTAALEHEINTGHPWAEYCELPLELRRRGSGECVRQIAELRSNFQKLAPLAAQQLAPHAAGALGNPR